MIYVVFVALSTHSCKRIHASLARNTIRSLLTQGIEALGRLGLFRRNLSLLDLVLQLLNDGPTPLTFNAQFHLPGDDSGLPPKTPYSVEPSNGN